MLKNTNSLIQTGLYSKKGFLFSVYIFLIITVIISFPILPQLTDNLFYLNAARNISEFKIYFSGLKEYQLSWPIFYSFILSFFSWSGIYISKVARSLNLVFFIASILLIKKNSNFKDIFIFVPLIFINFFYFETIIIEVTDILFFFQTFLLLHFLRKENSLLNTFAVFFITLIAAMTKFTAIIYPLTIIMCFILNYIIFKNRPRTDMVYFLLAVMAGFFTGQGFNSSINTYHTKTLGIPINLIWENDFSSVLLMLKDAFLNNIINLSSYPKKLNLLSSFFIPLRILGNKGFSVFISLPILYFVLLGLIKHFRNASKIRLEVCMFVIYLSLFLVTKNMATRHLILIFPFLWLFFLEGLGQSKLKNFLVLISLCANFSIISWFILFGNRGEHFGIINVANNKPFYKNEYQDLYKIINKNKGLLYGKNIYTNSNKGRFISYWIGQNIIYAYRPLNEISFKSESFFIGPTEKFSDMEKKLFFKGISNEQSVSLYKIPFTNLE